MSNSSQTPNPKKETIAPRHESLRAEFVQDEIPEERTYGEARLWIVARDPGALFCYWEFVPAEHPEAVGEDCKPHFHLRISRDGGIVETTAEIQPDAGNWFVAVTLPDSGYFAELGFFSKDVWCFIARSEETRTPPKSAFTDGAEFFATIPPSVSLRELRDLLASSAEPGEEVAQAAARVQSAARVQPVWTAEQERLLSRILAEEMEKSSGDPANSATLTQRVRRRLAAAEEAAAPAGPLPAMDEEAAPGSSWSSSAGASWGSAPGAK